MLMEHYNIRTGLLAWFDSRCFYICAIIGYYQLPEWGKGPCLSCLPLFLLLGNKLPQNFLAYSNNRYLLSYRFCDQEFGSSLTRWLWLGISYEVAVKMFLRLQSSKGFTETGGSPSRLVPLHGWWWKASVPHHMDLSIGPLQCPHVLVAGFPKNEWSKRDQGGSHIAFYDLVSEVIV